MTTNRVDAKCPKCGGEEADFFGFYTISTTDNKTIELNDYKCLTCNLRFTKERTDKNLHKEFTKGDKL